MTLVGPGLTLPWLVGRLGLREDDGVAAEAERRLADRVLRRLDVRTRGGGVAS